MEDELGKINIIHLHAVEETIRYIEKHGDKATYDGMVSHLSWYWKRGRSEECRPQAWMFDWIRCLVG